MARSGTGWRIADDDSPSDTGEAQREALTRVVDEGRARLTRSWPSLTATGLVGG